MSGHSSSSAWKNQHERRHQLSTSQHERRYRHSRSQDERRYYPSTSQNERRYHPSTSQDERRYQSSPSRDERKHQSSPSQDEKCRPSPSQDEKCQPSPSQDEKCQPSPSQDKRCQPSPSQDERCQPAPSKDERCQPPPSKDERCQPSPSKDEKCQPSPSQDERRCQPSTSQDERRSQPSTSRSRTSSNYALELQYFLKKRKESEDTSHKPRKKVIDIRLSTAAQFFEEEEIVEETVTTDKIAKLLREASSTENVDSKLTTLRRVQKLIIKKEPKLLDNFLDEVVSFQHDKSPDVRTFALNFIEDACKFDIQILPKIVGNLKILVDDPTINVKKKVIQTTAKLYILTIKWLCSAKNVDEVMEATWTCMTQLKRNIFALLESDNEGIRALVVKFMERIVITQTFRDQYSHDELSLDNIPVILNIFRPRKMEEEAKIIFQRIVDFHGASHVSSFNLMTCMQVLTTIARKRFEFFPKALQAFESLHANLPPTLSQSQVSSVRKSLKLQLFILVKHPGAVEFHSRITIMLSDLGASPQQISKCFPSNESNKKRAFSRDFDRDWVKKSKIGDEFVNTKASRSGSNKSKVKDTASDITAKDLVPKLNTINVADLVLVSMLCLPTYLPPHFRSTYTPIAAAGTEPQVKHLSRLLATQLTIAGLGKGAEEMKVQAHNTKLDLSDDDDDKQIQTVVGKTVDPRPKKQGLVLMPSGGPPTKSNKYSKKLDFASVAKPLTDEESDRLSRAAYNRILNAEKAIAKRGATNMRTKILTSLATQFRGDFATDLKNHILENPRNRLELAFSWIYQEYSSYKGFESSTERPVEFYEETIDKLVVEILKTDDPNRLAFSRFFIEPPVVTAGMTECLKKISTDETVTEIGLQLAKSMTVRRPTKKVLFLGVLCDLTLHEKVHIRSKAVTAAFEVYESGSMTSFIEAFGLRSLKFLLSDTPLPTQFIYFDQPPRVWSEELTKLCLQLYLALLPLNHKLIHDLGTVYVEASADIKRTILRALETPFKGMSMESPELLRFVEKCPKGAETIVTRIIHILTDKAPPSAELVSRVRDLYRKRVPDVRFLIPIINGLTKAEVIAALPELIKLNPTVVKEVFHRLLGSSSPSPVTPSELLVALHKIEPEKCNLKIVIKATSLCLEEKQVYTQVVLAMVLQELMEINPLPILFMRTVIQSLTNHPHLLGFVTNILQRLILKQVWNERRIWEGFIKCCQRTKPQSFQVLLQLPGPQLQEALDSCPDLRDPLCHFVRSFTDHQKSHVTKEVRAVLEGFRIDMSHKYETDSISDKNSDDESPGEPMPPGEELMPHLEEFMPPVDEPMSPEEGIMLLREEIMPPGEELMPPGEELIPPGERRTYS